MRRKVFFRSFFVIFILLGLYFPAEGTEDALFSKIKVTPIRGNKKAPDFCLENLNGKKLELKHFKEKVVFLNFWATWCGPCKEEMPSMEALYQQFKEKDFVFLAISVDYEGLNPVKAFIEKHRYTFPVLIDPNCNTLDLYQIKEIPATIIIDRKGKMVGRAIGPRDWKSSDVISFLNLLIKQ